MVIEYANNESDTPAPDMGGDDADETTTIPISMVRDGQPGDVVRVEIVSRDEDNGTALVKYASGKPMGGGIDNAASKFEE